VIVSTINYIINIKNMINRGDWGLGIGDWGLGIAIPNTQSPRYSINPIIKNI